MKGRTGFETGWFALAVRPRHEKAVARALRARQLEEFLPLSHERRVWSDRLKAVEFPLFAGYVFCRFGYPDRLVVLSTPGVNSIVGEASGNAHIRDEEITAIRGIVESGLPLRECPYLTPGQPVRVEHGPLAGIDGTILRTKGVTCVVVSVEILQRSVAVEIERDSVRPLLVSAPVPC
jgi:transcription antitermination factor NusG